MRARRVRRSGIARGGRPCARRGWPAHGPGMSLALPAGAARTRLREALPSDHLAMMTVPRPAQVERYARLRGY
ncbi:MAG: hypothetical protein O9972_42955 [Burkholderiales bacterium]|nr:hypothetical protein [Burkholderiales bacterium]